MNRVVNFFKENKKKLIFIILVIIVILTLIIGGICLFAQKKESNEAELIKTLELMGGAYYEEFYYLQSGSTDKKRIEFVQKFKETGITTTIDNLKLSKERVKKIKENIDNLKNAIINEECDLKQSKVQIIPKEPYGVKDYEVKATLYCGFPEDEEA